jgi:cyclase
MISRRWVTLGVGVAAAYAMVQAQELHTFHVQGNVYMIVGAGGNVTAQVGNDGVLLVNSGTAENASKLLAEVRKLSKGPIRYLINTDVAPDHVGGNEQVFEAGSSVAGGNVTGDIGDAGVGAAVIAHEAVLNRMSAPTGSKAPTPTKAWPNDTYFTKEKKMFFNGEAIEIIHIPAAETDGDSIVFFRRSDVISTSDLYVTTSYPIVDRQRGGNIQGVLDGLNRVIDITVPADQADVVEYRDMVTIIRDRIQDGVKKGLSLEQVKAAQPTLDYDAVFGSSKGSWTTDSFIEAVYKSLNPKK